MEFSRRFAQVRGLLLPVALNMTLTLMGWVGIYGIEKREPVKMDVGVEFLDEILLNPKHNYSSPLIMAVTMVLVYLVIFFDFRKFAQFWLSASTLFLLFWVSHIFIQDALIGPNVTETTTSQFIWTWFAAAVYGTLGAITFFTGYFPSYMHKAYVIMNCSMISQFYLLHVPGMTIWAIVVGIAAYSTFASMGLFNFMKTKSAGYGGNILRCLMYFEEQNPAPNAAAPSNSDTSDSEGEEDEEEDFEEPTALDVLNDDSTKLGMGDFVYYSMLVGNAAASGSILGTIGAFCGVLSGLIYCFVFQESSIPVLPFAIYFGISFHIVGYQAESVLGHIFHRLYDHFITLGF